MSGRSRFPAASALVLLSLSFSGGAAVLAALPPPGPGALVVSPDGKRVYVADDARLAVDVVDTTSNQLTGIIPIPGATILPGLAISPDGAQLYVLSGPDGLSIVDPAQSRVVTRLEVGRGTSGIAVSPDGGRVYVTNLFDYSLSVIDPAAGRVVATIPVGSYPTGVAVDPRGRWVYVANTAANGTVTVIDAATSKVHSTIKTQPFPSAVVANPMLPFVIVTHDVHPSGSQPTLMDLIKSPDQKQASPFFPGGDSPSMAVSPDGTWLYMIVPVWHIVGAVSWRTGQAEEVAVLTGKSPVALALSLDGKRLYVSDRLDRTVAAIDTDTFRVIGTVSLASTL